jgi:hypothetical protein
MYSVTRRPSDDPHPVRDPPAACPAHGAGRRPPVPSAYGWCPAPSPGDLGDLPIPCGPQPEPSNGRCIDAPRERAIPAQIGASFRHNRRFVGDPARATQRGAARTQKPEAGERRPPGLFASGRLPALRAARIGPAAERQRSLWERARRSRTRCCLSATDCAWSPSALESDPLQKPTQSRQPRASSPPDRSPVRRPQVSRVRTSRSKRVSGAERRRPLRIAGGACADLTDESGAHRKGTPPVRWHAKPGAPHPERPGCRNGHLNGISVPHREPSVWRCAMRNVREKPP